MSNIAYPEFIELVSRRYSCRQYDSTRPVHRDTVDAVIEAARLAPSACNKQPWTFVAVTDAEKRASILTKSRPSFVDAPVLIVACGHHAEAWHRPSDGKDHTDVDVSIAVEHLCLAAAALDLGTCWVCSFDVEATRNALSLPDDIEPIALIPLGYPLDEQIPEKKRKPLNEILKWGNF